MLRCSLVVVVLFVSTSVCFSVQATYNPLAVSNIACMITDGYSIYIGTSTNGQVYKVNVTDFSVTKNVGLSYPIGTCVLSGQYGVFGTFQPSAHLFRVQLSDLSFISSIDLSGSANDYLITSIAYGNYAYFGAQSTSGVLYKIDVPNWSLNQTIAYTPVANYGFTSAIQMNDIGYFGFNCTSGLVARINLTSLTEAGHMVTGEAATYYTSGVAYNGQLFFTERSTPVLARFESTNLNNFTLMNQNNSNLNNLGSGLVFGRYAYFANDIGQIAQFNMSTSSLVQTMQVPGMNFTSSVIIGSFAYFGSKNGSVVRVNLTVDCPGAPGGILNDGYSRDVYSSGYVCGGSCDTIKRTISCSNGVLYGNLTLPVLNCTVKTDCNCTTPYGTMLHNTTIMFYNAPTQSCTTGCVGLGLVCMNGVTQAQPPSYNYTSCSITPDCPCTGTYGSLLHNQNVSVYAEATPSCDGGCALGRVTCKNGTYTGATSYPSLTCNPLPDCPCSDGIYGYSLHNTSFTVYKNSIESCLTGCINATVTCINGNYTGDHLYTSTSCSLLPDCSCSSVKFGNLLHNDTLVTYRYNNPSCNVGCAANTGSITCLNGTIQGDTSYFASCSILSDCPCPTVGLVHNQSYYLYPQSLYCGNCVDISTTIRCFNGTVTGNMSMSYSSCNSIYNCSCDNAAGGVLYNGQSRDLYSMESAPCGTVCADYKETIRCNNGNILGTANKLYKSCSECVVPLQTPVNVTLNSTTTVITIYFPESPNTTATYSVAKNTSSDYRDPTQESPGAYEGTTFFITFYENSVETHTPPKGTFIDIQVNTTENAYLFYFDLDLNKWVRNCQDPTITSSTSIRVELCHATQYAIFHLTFESSVSKTTDITIIVVVIIVLVAVIAGMGGAVVWYRKRFKKTKKDRESMIEMSMTNYSTISGIQLLHKLGNGNFGEVYMGQWKGTDVALKKLKSSNSEQIEEFVKESQMLSKLSHPNIVQFIGIYVNDEKEKFIVTEYMPKGDLLSLLRRDEKKIIQVETLVKIARQAAAGMVYLEDQNIVHRDLALRNFLVASGEDNSYVVKVSDFGLSRAVSEENNYYTKENSQLPVKWSAPESLKYGKFSSKTDAWSFGVCLWELFSRGEMPYFTMTNTEAMEKVTNEGYRMPQPEECPLEMYKLMLWCWKANAEERPSFTQILEEIEGMQKPSKVEDIKVYEKKLSQEEILYN